MDSGEERDHKPEDEREHDIYGNAIIPPDGSGYEDPDFDGEAMLDHLLGYSE